VVPTRRLADSAAITGGFMSADNTVLETRLLAGPQENSVIEGLSTAEVRWILPGQVDAALVEWFRRFPAGLDACEDAYLIHPLLRRLSVKIRGGRMLEVKLCNGSPGILDTASGARGRIESWQKWSFPIGLLGPDDAGPPGWTAVYKRRWSKRFQLVSGGLMEESACVVDLTEVQSGRETWWSLGFEATGPATLLRSTLQGTAAVMFNETPPGDVELDMSHCQSYAEWLSRCRVPLDDGEKRPSGWSIGLAPVCISPVTG
jgi:hypothetical protein